MSPSRATKERTSSAATVRERYSLHGVNLPNAITIGRVLLVPVFLLFAFGNSNGDRIAAFIIFLVASLSDILDGYIARKNNQISRLGQFLDPTADKLLVGAALVALVAERRFPLWAAAALGVREVLVQILRTGIVKAGGTLPASPTAKMKTVLQIWLVSWWLLPWGGINVVHGILLGMTLVVSVISGTEYFATSRRVKTPA
jgi:CDP-diacylglycerol--glycerol-3-phosphate 3-phosphatidyltransferase